MQNANLDLTLTLYLTRPPLCHLCQVDQFCSKASPEAHIFQAAMATANVFDLPELTEEILLRLSPRRLFLVKRVNKSWKALIEGSVRLRRRTFMAPAGSILKTKHGNTTRKERSITPLLPETPFTLAPVFRKWNWHHPLPRVHAEAHSPCPWQTVVNLEWEMDGRMNPHVPDSVRNMYLTQPPIDGLAVGIQRRDDELSWLKRTLLHDANGIKIGQIVDAIMGLLQLICDDYNVDKMVPSWFKD
ncbi:uncharacterized protein LTR77_003673 [Saxophila tyrrhenica]|uniref:F-box domain-containing protein n=1 Tax=Saxophila tyrrhenica TaxID=1690608 RepID=A0AAV9PHQ4_9PEZI|nr:hypothetical protein LTR77_003673 [Saxophila tyrrhenica]